MNMLVCLAALTLAFPYSVEGLSTVRSVIDHGRQYRKDFRPHILFVLADDLGYHDVGFRGSAIDTPNIDRLASEGRVLDNYYVQPTCAPTRATIMTGRHTANHGIVYPFNNDEAYGISLGSTILPKVLAANGYDTHIVGKWHLGFYREDLTPTFRGFQTFYGYYGQGESYMSHEKAGVFDFRREDGPRCGAGCSIVEREAIGNYSTVLFTQRAQELIKNHDSSRPMFLYLAWQAVHSPMIAEDSHCSDERKHRYENAPRDTQFACALSVADQGLGKIIDSLRAKDMLKDSIIVFSSDNGGAVSTAAWKEDDVGSSNWPLRGGKHTLFEGGLRTVGFIWTGRWAASQQKLPPVYAGLMGSVDWFPTLLDAAGLGNVKASLPLDGVSHWNALSDYGSTTPAPREGLFVALVPQGPSQNMTFAARYKNWKFISGQPCASDGAYGWSGAHGSVLNDIEWPKYKEEAQLLFDIVKDPQERYDVSEANPDVVAKLYDMFHSHTQPGPGHSAIALTPAFPQFVPTKGIWEPWVAITADGVPQVMR